MQARDELFQRISVAARHNSNSAILRTLTRSLLKRNWLYFQAQGGHFEQSVLSTGTAEYTVAKFKCS
jgi:hypothetical protein